MPYFKYKALDNKSKKIKSGLVEAVSANVAVEVLQEKGFSVISVTEKSGFRKFKELSILDKIKSRDIVIFFRQFSVMISANIAIAQALKVLIDQTDNKKLKTIVSEIAGEVDAGAKLSSALAKRPKIFPSFYISVIRSGETSGKLDEVLEYLADEVEKDYDMMHKIRGAMIYPAFITTGLFAVGIIMMIYVVPKLTTILTETGAELPLSTKILIGTSGFLKSYWWSLLIILISLIISIKFYINRPQGRKQFDFLKLHLPVFGKLFQRIYLVRFARSMNTLIIGGVTITSGLKVSANVVGNVIYKDLINQTIKAVEDGNSISSVFITSKVIPKMVSQMLSIGEKTGKLDIVLDGLTNFYTREIDNTVANLMTLMEPIIMVIMGLAVGVMVAAVILPMYNLASQF